MTWNEILFWIFYNWLVAPVGYSIVVGAFFRQRRGALMGALIGFVTMIVSISGGLMVAELSQNPRHFFFFELAPKPYTKVSLSPIAGHGHCGRIRDRLGHHPFHTG